MFFKLGKTFLAYTFFTSGIEIRDSSPGTFSTSLSSGGVELFSEVKLCRLNLYICCTDRLYSYLDDPSNSEGLCSE
jgi:hypothetical protein